MSKKTFFESTKDLVIPTTAGAPKWQSLLQVRGPGENLAIILNTEYKALRFQIISDGILMPWGWGFTDIDPEIMYDEMYQLSKEKIFLANYDAVNDWYAIMVTLPLKWERELEITCLNTSIGDQHGSAAIIYDREVPEIPPPPVDIQEPEARKDPLM